MSPAAGRVRRVVTDRSGGASAAPYDSFNLADHVGDDPAHVAANRERLASSIGRSVDDLVWMEPIHGRTIRRIDAPHREPIAGCDGLLTTTPGLVLTALSADCVPILLADPVAGVIAAVHAGRVGVRLDVAGHAVAAMVAAGARATGIDALLGPAICGRCYEVPAAMQRDVESAAPGSASRTGRGSAGLDLRAGIRGQLFAAGVGQVVVDPRCTLEEPRLFSHRRDGVTGRQAGLVWLP